MPVYKPSGITMRVPVRQQQAPSANGNSGFHTRGRPKFDVTITLGEAVYKLATAAAKRRVQRHGVGQTMTVETLCAEIVGGVLTRGSVHGALRVWGDYQVDGRCGGDFKIATPLDEMDEQSSVV